MIEDLEDEVLALFDYLEVRGLNEEEGVKVMGAACNALIGNRKTADKFVETFMKAFDAAQALKEEIYAKRNSPH